MNLDPNLMLFTYYKNFFPVKELSEWLELDEFREISFCSSDGKYMRYLTFAYCEEFHEKLTTLVPAKIDIGAIYDVIPAKDIQKKAIKRELVFDIDLTDYERVCCKDKSVCDKCVVLIKVAVEILDYALRTELGFTNLGFVFSGRRGLHCWVNDKETKEFTEIERQEIINYFNTCCDKKIFSREYTEIMLRYSDYMTNQNFIDISEPFTEEDLYKKMFIRLDKDVTTSHAHLIKMPFCIHPNSGKLSIPIDPDNLNDFTLENVPTLEEIIKNPNLMESYVAIVKDWI